MHAKRTKCTNTKTKPKKTLIFKNCSYGGDGTTTKEQHTTITFYGHYGQDNQH